MWGRMREGRLATLPPAGRSKSRMESSKPNIMFWIIDVLSGSLKASAYCVLWNTSWFGTGFLTHCLSISLGWRWKVANGGEQSRVCSLLPAFRPQAVGELRQAPRERELVCKTLLESSVAAGTLWGCSRESYLGLTVGEGSLVDSASVTAG